jgi:hypothetical protein
MKKATRRIPRVLCIMMGSLILSACGFGYGPLQDHSEFASAQLTAGKRVVFAYHRFKYRPAAGWRAFPDGGIPKYVEDENVLGVFDPGTRVLKILRREKNTEWQPGSGTMTIVAVRGNKALIAQGGQLRGPFALGTRYILADVERGELRDMDLKGDLAGRGRDRGELYLADGEGTIVFVTVSLDQAKNPKAYRDGEIVPEIWVRTPSGEYLKAAASSHYQEVRDGEVIYWEPSTREHMAFSIANRKVRVLPGYKIPEYRDVTEGVILSPDRKALELGAKVNGEWKYAPLPLTPEMLNSSH